MLYIDAVVVMSPKNDDPVSQCEATQSFYVPCTGLEQNKSNAL